MATYGYVRKGFPYNEMEQLTNVMEYNCDQLFIEDYSLVETSELEALLTHLNNRDRVVVASLKVFGKNLKHLKPIITLFKEKQIQLISIGDYVDTQTDTFFYPLFDIFSEMDFDCKSERIKQQIVLAREVGKTVGRPALSEATIEQIQHLYYEYKWSMRRIANECEVSLGSVCKYTQKLDETVAAS